MTQEDGAEVDLPGVAVAWPESNAFESQGFAEEDGTRAPT